MQGNLHPRGHAKLQRRPAGVCWFLDVPSRHCHDSHHLLLLRVASGSGGPRKALLRVASGSGGPRKADGGGKGGKMDKIVSGLGIVVLLSDSLLLPLLHSFSTHDHALSVIIHSYVTHRT